MMICIAQVPVVMGHSFGSAHAWGWFFFFYSLFGWFIRAAMVPVVLRRQMAPGASWAWLGIVFLHPYIGLALYMLVGETRMRPGREDVHRQIVRQFRGKPENPPAPAGERPQIDPIYRPMSLQAEKISGLPIRAGNAVQFLDQCPTLVDRLVGDIDAARHRVHLIYYIFIADGTGNRVAAALERAAARGVQCRVLVDAVASRASLRHGGLAQRLIAAKVRVVPALAVGSLRLGLPRMDLRNHRKLAIIDDAVAYAGSHNLINPDYGGRCGGPWVDLTGRLTGPIVAEFQGVFIEDWAFETGEFLEVKPAEVIAGGDGDVSMQVVPTGPSPPNQTYRRLLLAAIQCARKQLILTTPYFVPDEPTLVSFLMAADRGVTVKLLLPLLPDHIFTAAAGRAHFAKLMDAGIQIYLYRPGLLHAKTTTVDDAFVLFGSANLDVRSFNLNFELSVLLYGAAVTEQMRSIQNGYLKDSNRLDSAQWAARSAVKRYADGAISLLSPLL